MRKLGVITTAAALAVVIGFGGAAKAEVFYSFDGALVGYWHFDTNAGADNAVNDGSTATLGVMNDGATRSTTIPTISNNTNSVELDGTDDFVSVAHDAGLDVTSLYTLSAWVNVDDISTFRPILFRGATDSNDIEVYYQIGNGLVVAHNRGNGGTFDWVRFVIPPVGSFFHLAVTFDGTDVLAYYDGVAAAVNGSAGDGTLMGAPDDTDEGWWIGKVDHTGFGGQFYFDGHIDDVRIYDVALSAGEIALLASGGVESDPYADEVASFVLPPAPPNDDCLVGGGTCDTTTDDDDQGADALDAPDNDEAGHGGGSSGVSTYTSLGFDSDTLVGGILTLNFTDNTCLDGGGDDIQIFEVSHGETYDVDVGIAGESLANIDSDVSGDASLGSSVAVFNQVSLEATSGGAVGTDGPDIDAAECLNNLAFGPDHIEKTNTGLTEIDVGVDVAQTGFEFTITIWNNTGSDDGLDGLIFRDVVPGEFDLDPPVAPLDDNGCTAELNHPAGAVKKNLEKLEPEFIDIDAGGLLNGQSCTITVGVATDSKDFPRGRSPGFTPTSCDTTIVLNEGVEVFLDDGDTEGEVDKNDTPLFVDDDSLELTCNFPS